MITSQDLILSRGSTITCDFDDVFFPSDNGTHARIKILIAQSVKQDLGANSFLAQQDSHGHLPYFPQYVLYKYIQTGRDANNPDFIKAMKNCYFGEDIQNPEHYRGIVPDPYLREQLERLKNAGVHFVILTSGPYNPHIKRVLSQLGIEEFLPRAKIFDVVRMCAFYADVKLSDFINPLDPKLLRWFKPTRENYLAMAYMAGLKPGTNIYLEDNDVNGYNGVTAVPLSQTSTQLFQDNFHMSGPKLELFNVSDQWGWINLENNNLRQNSNPPVIAGKSLVDVLKRISVGLERNPVFHPVPVSTPDDIP